jgi:hypothetical protein
MQGYRVWRWNKETKQFDRSLWISDVTMSIVLAKREYQFLGNDTYLVQFLGAPYLFVPEYNTENC